MKDWVACKWNTTSTYLYLFTSHVGEGGLNMTVDNPVNFFLNKIEPNILFYIYIKVCFELSQMALSI